MEIKTFKSMQDLFCNSKVGDMAEFNLGKAGIKKGMVFSKSLFFVRIQIEGRPVTSFVSKYEINYN